MKQAGVPPGEWLLVGGATIAFPESNAASLNLELHLKATDGSKNWRKAIIGLGDLLFASVGDRIANQSVAWSPAYPIERFNLLHKAEAGFTGSTLGTLIAGFEPDDATDPLYVAMREGVNRHELNGAPIVAFPDKAKKTWVAIFASEAYRTYYGRSSYLAQAFLCSPDWSSTIDKLVVPGSVSQLDASEIELRDPAELSGEYLDFAPKANVPSSFLPVVAQLIGNAEARKNAQKARQIVLGNVPGSDNHRWLHFGTPYPGDTLMTDVRGIPGTFRDNVGKSTQCFLAIQILNTELPHSTPFVTSAYEHDNRVDRVVDDESARPIADTEKSPKKPYVISDQELVDEVETEYEVNPQLLPKKGRSVVEKTGVSLGLINPTPAPRKVRFGRLDAGVPLKDYVRDDIRDPGTTLSSHEATQLAGGVRKTQISPAETDSEIDDQDNPDEAVDDDAQETRGYELTARTIIRLLNEQTVRDLRNVSINPSQFAFGQIKIQVFKPLQHSEASDSAKSNRWIKMGQASVEKRGFICVSFSYSGQRFMIIDVELRTKAEHFAALLICLGAQTKEEKPIAEEFLRVLRQNFGRTRSIKPKTTDVTFTPIKHLRAEVEGEQQLRDTALIAALDALASEST